MFGPSWIEWAGVITGLLGIWLTVRVHILCWMANIISSLIYIYVFYHSRLYADGFLQIIFIVLSIWAWINWDKSPKGLPILTRRITRRELTWGFMISAMASVLIGYILKTFTNDSLPFSDGICFVTSVWATYLTAYFVVENWIIWIGTNIFYILIYIQKELYPTSFFYAILGVLAVIGFIKWKKASVKIQFHE